MRRKTSEILWQDAQHQELFDIIDLLRLPDADGQVLQRLSDYTRHHFGLEEHYMLVLDFPGRAAHEAAHMRFRTEIDELLSGGGPYDEVSRDIIATFLTEWLTRHVFGIDKELERFLLDSDSQ